MSQQALSQIEPAHLRALLTMSRELLQTDDTLDVLGLAGRGIAELTQADSALMIVKGDTESLAVFDAHGRPLPANVDHPYYQMAVDVIAAVPGRRGALLPASPGAQAQRVLVLGVPVTAAMTALAAGWKRGSDSAVWAGRERILFSILELAAAALGKIEARRVLERLVLTQYAQIADTEQAHAAELARRDVAENNMRLLSLTDVLTGLNNRRGFFVHAEHVFKLAQRRHARSAVIFADIDGLKVVNDELGHEAGDRLIRDAAAVFRESFRDADVIGRLGGDEFVAYTLDDVQPRAILARLQHNLHAFNLMQDRPYRVAISAGIVQCDSHADQGLLNYVLQADQQMYAQKRRRLH
jgi:diguanylate cyclase (GGDEF)-like protein